MNYVLAGKIVTAASAKQSGHKKQASVKRANAVLADKYMKEASVMYKEAAKGLLQMLMQRGRMAGKQMLGRGGRGAIRQLGQGLKSGWNAAGPGIAEVIGNPSMLQRIGTSVGGGARAAGRNIYRNRGTYGMMGGMGLAGMMAGNGQDQ